MQGRPAIRYAVRGALGAVTLLQVLAAQDPAAAADGATEVASRVAALERLAAAGTAAAAQAPAIAARLCDEDHAVRRAAVRALLAVRPDLAPVRERVLGAVVAVPPEPQEVWSGWQALGHGSIACPTAPPVPLDTLRRALESPDPAARRDAVWSLCRRGDEARVVRDDLLALARDPDATVRAAVADAAARFGWAPSVRDVLAALLKDRDAVVRGCAALGMAGEHGDALAVAALRAAVQDPDASVRTAIVRALGRCGEPGRAAAGEVASLLCDRDVEVRLAALATLATLRADDERTVAMVAACLDIDDGPLLAAALRTLAAIGPAAGSTFDGVLVATHHERGKLRRAALDTARRVASPADRGRLALRLVEALRDPNAAVQQHAANCLRACCVGAPHDPPR